MDNRYSLRPRLRTCPYGLRSRSRSESDLDPLTSELPENTRLPSSHGSFDSVIPAASSHSLPNMAHLFNAAGPNASTVTVLTQSVDIRPFSGRDPALLESWFSSVEARVRSKGTAVTDADLISMATSTLDYKTGDAYLVAETYDLKKIRSWDNFKQFFRKRYSSVVDRDPFGIARQIANAVMRPDETRNAFGRRLDELHNKLKSALTGSRW